MWGVRAIIGKNNEEWLNAVFRLRIYGIRKFLYLVDLNP
jgi:hypothetical protein